MKRKKHSYGMNKYGLIKSTIVLPQAYVSFIQADKLLRLIKKLA